jgi:hypothetical protein
MPLEADLARHCVGWVACGVFIAIEVARSEPRGIAELFGLEFGAGA